ncbi:MAG: vWA domain-containing protein [Bacteriovoracia bacterium]
MRKRRQIEVFSISFLDLLSGALGAVIILYVAIPKNKKPVVEEPKQDIVKEILRKDLATSKEKIEELKKELEATKEKLAAVPVPPEDRTPAETPAASSETFEVGFKFKGKNIVFIIDTSYSMIEEDRMGQVKAGIKMLLTSLPGNYRIEIVQFPLGQRAPFRSMWGTTKDFKGMNRHDAFDFVSSLRPSGGTPTRDTLLFVLNNYENVSDIVLLSDGAPSYHNSNRKDDIYEILRLVREANKSNTQINAIGVGAEFMKDKTSEQYKFLSLLASDHNGFFVGF